MTEELLEDLDGFVLARLTMEFHRGTPPADALTIINQLLQRRLRETRSAKLQLHAR